MDTPTLLHLVIIVLQAVILVERVLTNIRQYLENKQPDDQ